MKYLKVWTDFADVIEALADDEAGRLFVAMLHYAATGEEPDSFIGNERFVWPIAKRDINHAAEESRIMRENGRKGGIAKSKNKQKLANDSKSYQTVANDSKENQTEPNESQKEKKRKEKKGNEIKTFIDDDEAGRIQKEQDIVLDTAETAGFARNDATRAKLISLYASNGLEKMREGIESCVDHGVCNIAYLQAVLKGEPRKAKADVSAQKYAQRDYNGEQDEALSRMLKLGGYA